MTIERRERTAGFGRADGPIAAPPARRRAPSLSSRLVPVLLTLVGLAIVVITQAVRRGVIVGVEVTSMAYVFGGVLIVLGIMGVGRRAEPEVDPAPAKAGPPLESGRDPGEADEEADLRETLRRLREERARDRDSRGN